MFGYQSHIVIFEVHHLQFTFSPIEFHSGLHTRGLQILLDYFYSEMPVKRDKIKKVMDS